MASTPTSAAANIPRRHIHRHQQLSGDRPGVVVPFPDTAPVPRYTDLQGAVDFAIGELATRTASSRSKSRTPASVTAGPLDHQTACRTSRSKLRAADGSRPTLLLDGEIVVTGDALAAPSCSTAC